MTRTSQVAPLLDAKRLVDVWTFPRGIDHALAFDVALSAFEPPDLRVTMLSSTADTITVQVVEGVAPYDGDLLFYVGEVGAFEVVRRNVTPGQRGPSVVLVLARSPRP
jgi:hypothetical protein